MRSRWRSEREDVRNAEALPELRNQIGMPADQRLRGTGYPTGAWACLPRPPAALVRIPCGHGFDELAGVVETVGREPEHPVGEPTLHGSAVGTVTAAASFFVRAPRQARRLILVRRRRAAAQARRSRRVRAKNDAAAVTVPKIGRAHV